LVLSFGGFTNCINGGNLINKKRIRLLAVPFITAVYVTLFVTNTTHVLAYTTSGIELNWKDKTNPFPRVYTGKYNNPDEPLNRLYDDRNRGQCSVYNIRYNDGVSDILTSFGDFGYEVILEIDGERVWVGRNEYLADEDGIYAGHCDINNNGLFDYGEDDSELFYNAPDDTLIIEINDIQLASVWFQNIQDGAGNIFTQINFDICNSSSNTKIFNLATTCDLQIGSDDNAYCKRLLSGNTITGFTTSNCNCYAAIDGDENAISFNIYGRGVPYVTDCDNIYLDDFTNRFTHCFDNNVNQDTVLNSDSHDSTITGDGIDSGFAIGWQNRSLGPHETTTFSYILGVAEFQDNYTQTNKYYKQVVDHKGNTSWELFNTITNIAQYGAQYSSPNALSHTPTDYCFIKTVDNNANISKTPVISYTVVGNATNEFYYVPIDAPIIDNLNSSYGWTNREVLLEPYSYDTTVGLKDFMLNFDISKGVAAEGSYQLRSLLGYKYDNALMPVNIDNTKLNISTSDATSTNLTFTPVNGSAKNQGCYITNENGKYLTISKESKTWNYTFIWKCDYWRATFNDYTGEDTQRWYLDTPQEYKTSDGALVIKDCKGNLMTYKDESDGYVTIRPADCYHKGKYRFSGGEQYFYLQKGYLYENEPEANTDVYMNALIEDESMDAYGTPYIALARNAANKCTTYATTIKIDKTAPCLYGLKGEYNVTEGNQTLSITASDALSGVAYFAICDSEGKELSVSSDKENINYLLTKNNTGVYSVKAMDYAGNELQDNTFIVTFNDRIDLKERSNFKLIKADSNLYRKAIIADALIGTDWYNNIGKFRAKELVEPKNNHCVQVWHISKTGEIKRIK
jgi:hypothetical protein